MTAPQQPVTPTPEQAPMQPDPTLGQGPAPAPAENGAQATAPWPPDDATMMQLMMDARFSIIEESAGVADSDSADLGAAPADATPQPAPAGA